MTPGKTFRITNIGVSAVSTSATTNFFTFRQSLSSGILNTSSPVFYQTVLNSAGNIPSNNELTFPEGIEFYNGAVGFSYNSSATASYVYILGYEY